MRLLSRLTILRPLLTIALLALSSSFIANNALACACAIDDINFYKTTPGCCNVPNPPSQCSGGTGNGNGTGTGTGGGTPEMSDYLAMAFIIAGGGLIIYRTRNRVRTA